MSRPLLLDLFCGGGGCAAGYRRAGFDVVGVDLRPQPRFPFPFARDDALNALQWLIYGYALIDSRGVRYQLSDFAAIHASPPCQRYSVAANIAGRGSHPDLVGPCRELLVAAGKPWVIENVPGAPLLNPVLVCGLALGCSVKRHRLFEASFALSGTVCPPRHDGYVTVFGGGAPARPDNRRRASAPVARRAMGIDWMTRDELSQAVPPAYCEFIGRQLLAALESRPCP